MRIGSITKQLTAALIFILAEEGRLNLARDARAYLPALPEIYAGLSLKHLMSHTSGLWCHVSAHILANGGGVAAVGDDEAFAAAVRQQDLNFMPGERLSYSNAVYLVLSRVIEAVENEPLEGVLRRRLFVPLAMRDTALVRSDLHIEAGLADLHLATPRGARGVLPLPMAGEGGVVSTTGDMIRWLEHLDAPTVFAPWVWRAMNEPVSLGDGRMSNFAYGVMRDRSITRRSPRTPGSKRGEWNLRSGARAASTACISPPSPTICGRAQGAAGLPFRATLEVIRSGDAVEAVLISTLRLHQVRMTPVGP